MKIKLFILGLSLGISILSGCNDDLTQVGTGIQPENGICGHILHESKNITD